MNYSNILAFAGFAIGTGVTFYAERKSYKLVAHSVKMSREYNETTGHLKSMIKDDTISAELDKLTIYHEYIEADKEQIIINQIVSTMSMGVALASLLCHYLRNRKN